MRLAALWIIVLALAAGVAAAQPAGFQNHIFNGNNPVHAGGVTTFHVDEGDCSAIDYGDGRGESDCYNGNLRSRIAYRDYARLGSSVQYRMEILIPATLSYGGGPNRRSLLEVAEWQRINTIKNHIHTLHLDGRRGLTFDDTVCIPPAEFGQWAEVVVQVRWSADDDGVIQVLCNDRPVVVRRGPTAIPPDCGAPGVFQCDPSRQDLSQPVQFQAGILFRGYGPRAQQDGLSRAGRVPPPGGFTIQMRNLRVSPIRF